MIGTALSLVWTVHDYWDDRPDAARYLLAARSLATGQGYTVMGEPFRLRPPGFSLALAPLVALRGFDFAAANLFVSLFGILAVVAFFLLTLPRVGPAVALAAAGVVWVNPQLQALSNQVMSDVPSLALALLALLATRWANARPSFARDGVVVVTIALAAYVRSANVLLLPAVLVERASAWVFVRSREPARRFVLRRLLAPPALFAALYLPWALQPSSASQYDSPDLYAYSTAFLRSDPNDPTAARLGAEEWLVRIGRNVEAYAATFGSAGATRRTSPVAPLVAGVGALALLVTLLRRRAAPEIFAAGTLLVLLGYYVSATRLLLPVFVLTVGAIADTVRWIGMRFASARMVDGVLVGALLVVAALSMSVDAQHARDRGQYESLLATAQHLRETVPATAPLGGDVGAVYALLLDRPVYSLRPISRRKRRHELVRLIEERGIVAMVARRDGPLAPVLETMAASGGTLVTLPHHLVLHLPARGMSETGGAALGGRTRGDAS